MVERTRTGLTYAEESKFREVYASWAKANGRNINPDAPQHKYDYRGAFKAGFGPNGKSGAQHWPSKFKDDDHPNRYVDDPEGNEEYLVPGGMLDSKYERPVSKVRQPQILLDKLRAKVTGS